MSIDKKIQNYQHFFSDQVREAEMEQKSIIKAFGYADIIE